MNEMYASLPQVERLLQQRRIEVWFDRISRPVAVDAVRLTVARLRSRIEAEGRTFSLQEVIQACEQELEKAYLGRLKPLINATGVIIHTNLARAPISSRSWDEAKALNCRYTNLEFDLEAGKRGMRSSFTTELLCRLTASEAALVVNNNAGAIFLMLTTFAKGKRVIVSRSELVQIGGGFRIPDILTSSGAKLVEVGTTNITTIDDYLGAIDERTAMVLKVHRSNFALRGFTEEPTVAALAKALPPNILLVVDQGSGVVGEGVAGERPAGAHIKDGAHLVSFSADKALGSVQAGCIVGGSSLITKLAKHPLYRTLRVGKTISSLLEASLIDHLNGRPVPVLAFASRTIGELEALAQKILVHLDTDRLSVVEDTMTLGGGSTPDESLPSRSIRLASAKAHKDAHFLRSRPTPIIATVSKGALLLNVGTVFEEECEEIALALKALLGV
ncbi:MAG: L-seryl-tRNA(Sec) selenium transferase [Sphaerochaeta sp.]|jgi:L-seryl-tRNA(Ser) seleniumtransferase|nr:L-seryl-tRNA(Sec) selenium transferase [Sphaerochaeta sp.]MDX9914813.1 L-seryl-tRNA(Sec) selenium transferase [Sphaerochaeta sp.]